MSQKNDPRQPAALFTLALLLLAVPACSAFHAIDEALWTPTPPATQPPTTPEGALSPPGEGTPAWAQILAAVAASLGFGWGAAAIRTLGRELTILRNGSSQPPKLE